MRLRGRAQGYVDIMALAPTFQVGMGHPGVSVITKEP
jgi:hypothetical protein